MILAVTSSAVWKALCGSLETSSLRWFLSTRGKFCGDPTRHPRTDMDRRRLQTTVACSGSGNRQVPPSWRACDICDQPLGTRGPGNTGTDYSARDGPIV